MSLHHGSLVSAAEHLDSGGIAVDEGVILDDEDGVGRLLEQRSVAVGNSRRIQAPRPPRESSGAQSKPPGYRTSRSTRARSSASPRTRFRRGVPERHLQTFLAHRSVESMRRYARLADNAMPQVLRPPAKTQQQPRDEDSENKAERDQGVGGGPSRTRS
jgi:hypothetical protein